MDRRKFFSVTSAGAAAVAAGSVSQADAAAPAAVAEKPAPARLKNLRRSMVVSLFVSFDF